MKPIRSERNRQVVHDPWTKEERECNQTEQNHIVGTHGGVESAGTVREFARDCGCVGRPAGGFCAVCRALVCSACACRCVDCAAPLGPCHARLDPSAESRVVRCPACHGGARRKRILAGVGRAFLSLFVEFPNERR